LYIVIYRLQAFGGIEYEHNINDKNSIVLGLGYNYRDFRNKGIYKLTVIPEYRYYLSKDRIWPGGIYMGGYGIYKDFYYGNEIDNVYSINRLKAAGFGVLFGYQFRDPVLKRFVLDYNFGIGYNIYKTINNIEGNPNIGNFTKYVNLKNSITLGFLF